MQDPESAAVLLNRIAALGVRLSIDDFGTGYSSLSYLRRLPISALKIDRSFVADMVREEQDAVIVRSTIGLAHNLDLQVIAEGVEDAATLTMLGEMGCDQAQGYFISRPLPAEQVLQAIERGPGADG
jgi:EAL domain-containing protein (putative c-di-GMP-specific phosphodiesterase class I)